MAQVWRITDDWSNLTSFKFPAAKHPCYTVLRTCMCTIDKVILACIYNTLRKALGPLPYLHLN